MCRTCGCGDMDEYEDDIEELAADDPAWAYALAREDDLSVTEDDGSWQQQEEAGWVGFHTSRRCSVRRGER